MLKRCVSVMDDEGAVVPLAEEMRTKLEETVTNMASTGLRTLCLTLRDMYEGMAEGREDFWENPPDEELTLCCIVGIKVRLWRLPDPLQLQRANACTGRASRQEWVGELNQPQLPSRALPGAS